MSAIHRTLLVAGAAASLGCHNFVEPRMPTPAMVHAIGPRATPVGEIEAGPVLAGFVVDPQTRKPVQASRVALISRERGRDSVAEAVTATAVGGFALKPLPAGRYVLQVHGIGYNTRELAVTVRPETAGSPVTIAMVVTPGCTWADEIVMVPAPKKSRRRP